MTTPRTSCEGERLVSRDGFPEEIGLSVHMDRRGKSSATRLVHSPGIRNWAVASSSISAAMVCSCRRTGSRTRRAIVPVDMNLITDDDFRILRDTIPDGMVFTFVAERCTAEVRSGILISRWAPCPRHPFLA